MFWNCAPLREYVQGSKFWILVFDQQLIKKHTNESYEGNKKQELKERPEGRIQKVIKSHKK